MSIKISEHIFSITVNGIFKIVRLDINHTLQIWQKKNIYVNIFTDNM